jgi:hypothetical protein
MFSAAIPFEQVKSFSLGVASHDRCSFQRRLVAANLQRLESRSHEKDWNRENSRDNADRPAPIISHVNGDPASGIGKIIDQRLLDVKLDAVSLQREILAVVDGLADPTDRPIYPVSSSDDGAASKN